MSTPQGTIRSSFALLQYYIRERLWRHALTICSEMISTLGDPAFLLWRAFAADMEGQVADAMRDYKQCEGKRSVHLASLVGMQLIYKRNNDTEGVAAIETRLRQEDRTPNWTAWLHAAGLLWHGGDPSRARDILNRMLDADADFRDEYTSVQLVRAWLDLTCGRGATIDKCGAMFDRVIAAEASDGIDIDATMGKIALLERKNQFWPAQDLLNRLTVAHPNFAPALIVKAKQLARAEDWDTASELFQRILTKDPMHIEALILSVVHNLVKDGRATLASRTIAELIKALQHREPRNAQLYVTCAQCFSRLASGNMQILTLTTTLAEGAAQMAPTNTEFASEVAFQAILRGDLRTATTIFKKCSTSGDGNVTPLLGLIYCTIQSGKLDEAQQQVDFLTEIQGPNSRNSQLYFLAGMLKWRRERNVAQSVDKFDQAAETHRLEVANTPTGLEFYAKLNPYFMLQLVKEYLQHCRTEPMGADAKPDPLVEKVRRILDLLLRHFPGCTDAQLINARLAFIAGDVERALTLINHCISQDSSNPTALLLCAHVNLFAGQYAAASSSLEQALSLDFQVRDMPLYSLLKGQLLQLKGEYAESLTVLEQALVLQRAALAGDAAAATTAAPTLSVPGGAAAPAAAGGAARRPKVPLGPAEHAALMLQLAQAQMRLKHFASAQNTIREATEVFRDGPQAGRVLIAYATVLARTDADQAIEILRTIPAGSDNFLAAKAQMAQLYLTVKVNRRAFARCYEELVEAAPTAASYVSLGDAYASIQEPEKAIAAFERARAMDPNNAELAVKIGRTLISTHDFQKALRYYRDAVAADSSRPGLRLDLASLYWRLGDFERAKAAIRDSPTLARQVQQDDLAAALGRVSLVLLLSKICRAASDSQGYVEALLQARVFQASVLAKCRTESTEILASQKAMAAGICTELGEHHTKVNLPEKALTYYNEALKHDETDDRAMLALAQLYLNRGELDGCELQCNALLRIQPQCEAAIVMLADLMFRKNRFEDAAQHFSSLLEKKPHNYSAMVHYVNLLRRSGHLQDAAAVFTQAEAAMRPGQRPDPGFCYAKGLYSKYVGDARTALKELNLARTPRDGPWSQPALVAMIECYINPDNENLWEDVEVSADAVDNLRTAEKLLREIRDVEKRAVLEGYVWIASKKKENLDRAITKFYELMTAAEANGADGAAATPPTTGGDGEASASPERLHVPALVGMAIAHQVLKQTPKARNHLKRLGTKPNFNPDEDDDYERGFLLLASIYIESGKHDLALDLLTRALTANKSCGRAWEAKGLIHEKEQAYKDAAECYEAAWRLCNGADPGIGYKLAFNFLKAKKFVQAIDVCHKVLDKHPTYPKIRKEILDRARASLKP